MSKSVVLLAGVCITINMSFLYYSGILVSTAKNMDEMSKLTHSAARIATSLADYLDIFHRIEEIEKIQQLEYMRSTSGGGGYGTDVNANLYSNIRTISGPSDDTASQPRQWCCPPVLCP